MIWAPLCAAVSFSSCVATTLTTYKLWHDWYFRVSSVYWLLLMLCGYASVFAAMRLAYFAWLSTVVSRNPGEENEHGNLDRLGIHRMPLLKQEQGWAITVVVVVGDSALFAIFLWLSQLTYHLSSLLSQGMDDGENRERQKIRRAAIGSHMAIATLFTAEMSIGLRFGGYSVAAQMVLISVYILLVATIAYMVFVVVWIKIKGRNLDAVDGERVVAPIYRRLEVILLLYAAAASQFHILSLVFYFGRRKAPWMWMGLSMVANNATGLLLSIAITWSQPCLLRWCGCLLLPPDSHSMLVQDTTSFYRLNELRSAAIGSSSRAVPAVSTVQRMADVDRPVFVFTDIESSSALWGFENGRVMQAATDVHDSLIRSVLAILGGYEIATAGDAFHLAFPTIERALLFCLTVQLRLMTAKWPKKLCGLVQATKTVRRKTKVIFRGLRVRMGIHCYDPADGPLVRSIHTVTGTITFSGATVIITETIAELAAGGQILMTAPIAAWALSHQDQIPIPFVVDDAPVGDVCLSHSGCSCSSSQWELYHLFPQRLARRRELLASDDNRDCRLRVASLTEAAAACGRRHSIERRTQQLDSVTEALAVLSGCLIDTSVGV